MFTIRNITFLSTLLLLSHPLSALAFSTTVADTYYFGSGDSKVTAKEILLANLKKSAADKAGVYIQSDKSISASGYKESIKVLSASIVKLTLLSEKMGVKSNGQIYLTIKARANVNDNELKKRIRAIQSDRSKDTLIKALRKDRKLLDKKLTQLKKALKSKHLNSLKVSRLLQDQSDLANDISLNEQAVSNVFERGSLMALANKTDQVYKKELISFKKKYIRFWKDESKRIKIKLDSINKVGTNQYQLILKTYINRLQLIKRFARIYLPGFKNGFKMLSGSGINPKEDLSDKIKRNTTKAKMLARAKVISDNNVYIKLGVPKQKRESLYLGFGQNSDTFFGHRAQRHPIDIKQYQGSLNGVKEYYDDNIFFCKYLCSDILLEKSTNNLQFFKLDLSENDVKTASQIEASFILK